MHSNPAASAFTIISTSLLMTVLQSVILLLVVVCTSTQVYSEEILDTSYPILISERLVDATTNKSNSSSTESISRSYFGYSVSLAQGKTTPKHPKGWIFIGAPKSNTTKSARYALKDIEPGVMWRCSLGHSSSSVDSCEMMNIDPPLKVKGQNAKAGNPRSENHNGAFIGVTSEINHDRFVSCGMRWKRGANQFYNGVCYWFADVDNAEKTSYRTNDLAKLVNKNLLDQRLMPFFTLNIDAERVFNFMTRKKVVENGYEWQLGQAGMSIHLFLDAGGKSTNPNLLIGAPGVRQWAGAVVLYTNAQAATNGLGRLNRNFNDPTFSEFIVLNRGLIPKEEDRINNFHWDEYFGYSVSSGKYLSKDQVLYAAGAPRANHCGAVVIFDAPPKNDEDPSSIYKRQIRSFINITAPNNSFASYFGSVLYSADFDEDGYDELVVAAPLYTFANAREIGDQGCVFVYRFKSTQGDLVENVNPLQELVGSRSPRARFGSAITSMRMESKNSALAPSKIYLVIGAPFELAEDASNKGVGAVYLYLYNRNTRKFDSFAQQIHASRISSTLNGFGSSLGIPQDIDMNETPDLGIGSFKSGHAVVLRTRPTILITSWMKFASAENSDITTVRRGTHDFFLRSCFSIKEIMGLVAPEVVIWTKLEFSDKTIKFHDKHVAERAGNTPNKLIQETRVNVHQSEICETLTIVSVHKDGFGMDDFAKVRERIDPFTFIQEVWYNETLDHSVSVVNVYAEAPSKPEVQNATFSSFNSNLPSTQKVTSSASVDVSISDCRDRVCRPNLEMSWSFFLPHAHNQNVISSYEVGQSNELIMQLNIRNTGETAERPKIAFYWDIMSITESPSGNRWLHKHECKDASDSTARMFELCNLKQYIIKGHNVLVQIHFNMENFYATYPENFKFVVNAQVSFHDTHLRPVRSHGELLFIVPKTEVAIHGSKLVENEILRGPASYSITKLLNGLNDDGQVKQEQQQNNEILYASFRQRFTLLVQGAPVHEAVANFDIPVSWDGQQIFMVKQPHGKSENILCQPVSSSKFSFHKIGVISGKLNVADIGIGNSGVTESMIMSTTEPSQDLNDSMPEDKLINAVRRRREVDNSSTDDTNQTETMDNEQPHNLHNATTPAVAVEVDAFVKDSKLTPPPDALQFKCASNNKADCLAVRCTIKNVKANIPIHIPFEMFPIKQSMDELLKSTGKSVMYIEAAGSVHIYSSALLRKTYHDSDTAQVILKKSTGKVQSWVYAVAAASGFFLLVLIILALCKCGFFKRDKRHELNHLRAELNRKSKMAGGNRTSMVVMQSGSNAGIKKSDHPSGDEYLKSADKCKQRETSAVSYKELELEEKKSL